jgi:parallel beta-helix repeat protein
MRAMLAGLIGCFVFGCGGSDDATAPDGVDSSSTEETSIDDSSSSDVAMDVPTTDATDGGTDPGTPVYGDCATPSKTFSRTIYVDPAAADDTGDGSAAKPFKTLSTTLKSKKLLPGDHVVLLAGDHGAVQVTKYTNAELVGSKSWIWLDFKSGATAQTLVVADMSSWLITHAEVTADSSVAKSALVSFSSSTDMILADSHLYTVKDSSSWKAADWIDSAANGISVRNGSCISLVRNKVLNTRFGIAIFTDAKMRPDSSMKTLAQGNEVANFSGDGMRVIASDVTIKGNYVHDVYVNAADGDDNHDDGLQMWALDGATFDNIRIEGNWFQESTNATRPLQNELQGIDDFDGVNTHVVITNNVVLASAYHGIALYGSQDSSIDHNTVANPTSNGHKLWVGVFDTKGSMPSKNITATDNAAVSFSFSMATTGFVNTNNVAVPDGAAGYTTFDTTKMIFDLTPKPGGPLAGKGAGASLVEPPAPLP